MTSPTVRHVRVRLATLTLAGLGLTGCAAVTSPAASSSPPTLSSAEGSAQAAGEFANLEEKYDARLGVYALDTATWAEVAWRDDERFAYASTVKAMAAAAVLDTVGLAGLARTVPIDAADIVTYSPVTELHIGGTMTLGEIAEAAITVSDNTAANLMFDALGGPASLGAALIELGDETSVVSRAEPDLNEALPGDDRDTTTPRAFAANLDEYLFGDRLTDPEKSQLEAWLIATQTGDALVRAELPADWIVGDKSGAGGYGTRNDLALIRPPERAPIIISVMSRRAEPDAEYDDALIAEAAAAAIAALDAVDEQ
ncbi:class A beta-lactamase [Pengzhenrongella sicca]|uniref:Beta-lactamase n=1 Tax=Pengzhenrongella sicca TaxID=2819238 RepID=A0A8A4ZJ42_9MICO|nr:class A beta-lactamase [Pengzhenrongella sicca]QTE31053.1 class A beta-lactamase [Pengzhenrongella sicca]